MRLFRKNVSLLVSKKLLMFIVVTVALTSKLIPRSSSIEEYKVGADVGNWVKYGNITMSGSLPSSELNRTWVKIEVQKIEGANVTLLLSASVNIYGIESTVDTPLAGNIADSSGDLSGFIIPANLTKGDIIPSSQYGSNSSVVDGVVARFYAGANRSVILSGFSAGESYTGAIRAYWDQRTGMLLELNLDMTSPTIFKMTIMATETNMWLGGQTDTTAGNMTLLQIAVVTMIAVAGIVFIILREIKRTQSPRSIRRRHRKSANHTTKIRATIERKTAK